MKTKLISLTLVASFFSVLFDLVLPFFTASSFFNAFKLLCYFTVQTNVIVFIYFLILLFDKKEDHNKFHAMFGGVLIYIFITMSVFIIFLQPIYHPTGFRAIGSIFAHYITPSLVIWYFFNQKDYYIFRMEHLRLWAIYPISYLLFVMLFGVITNDYLYPFFQVSTVGIGGVTLVILGLGIYFISLSIFVVKMVSKE